MPAAHKPTDESRATVSALTWACVPQDAIAEYVGITKPTLAKHYAKELQNAIAERQAIAGEALMKLVRRGSFPAIQLALRRGETNSWRDNPKIEHGGRIDGDGSRVVVTVPDNGRLAVEQTNGKTADAPPG